MPTFPMKVPQEAQEASETPQSWSKLVDGLASSTAASVLTAGAMADAETRGPPLLPGWSRGHVLTYLARNADGMVNLVGWAVTKERRPVYASLASRAADIEAGAGRAGSDLATDVSDAADRLADNVGRLYAAGPKALARLVEWGAPRPNGAVVAARRNPAVRR